MANTAADIQKLYIAYFNRPADPAGLAYWTASSMSITQIANSFAEQAEYKAAFAGQSTETIVSTLYVNLFARAAEPAGLLYWVGEINAGRSTLGSAAINILNGAKDADKIAVDSKVKAAASFTTAIEPSTDAIVAYSKAGGTAAAKTWLGAVTTDATALTQIAAQAAVIKSIVDGATSNIALTNGTDRLAGTSFEAGLVYTPDGGKRINALQDEDQLTGTGASNTLTATLGNANDNGGQVITPKLTNIQTINVAFTGSSNASSTSNNAVNKLDLQDSTGLTALNVSRITDPEASVTIDNMTSVPKTISLNQTNSPSGTESFTFTNQAVSGTTDATVFTLNDVKAAGVKLESKDGSAGVEAITLTSSGAANSVGVFTAQDVKTLTINGDKALTLGAKSNTTSNSQPEATRYAAGLANVAGSLTKIDASALTAALDLTIGSEINAGLDNTSGVNVDLAVTGGSGNDIFRLATGSNIDTADTIVGGAAAGTDTNTLVLLGNNTIAGTVTKVQALEIRTGHDALLAADTVSVDASKITDLAKIYVRNEGQSKDADPATTWTSGAEAATVSLSKLNATQAGAITVAHGTTGNSALANLTLNVGVTAVASATGVTIVDGTNTNPVFNFRLNTNSTVLTVTDSDTESNTVYVNTAPSGTGSTINLVGGVAKSYFNMDTNSGNSAAAAVGRGGYGYATDGTTGSNTTAVDTAGNLDYASVFTVYTAASADRLLTQTFDGSKYLGDITARFGDALRTDGVSSQSIKGGDGNDTFIFDALVNESAGFTSADTVAGGKGTDALIIDGNTTDLAGTPRVNHNTSEWDNVTGIDVLRFVKNEGVANVGNAAQVTVAGGGYYAHIDNDFISQTDAGNRLTVVNNDGDNTVNSESDLVLDLTGLSQLKFVSFAGANGATGAAGLSSNRVIVDDVSSNQNMVLDGGDTDIRTSAGSTVGNNNVYNVKNTANSSVSDLSQTKNFGLIEFTNDQATAQTLNLTLSSVIVGALVDAGNTASATRAEILKVTAIDNGATASALNIDARAVTGFHSLNVAGSAAGNDVLRLDSNVGGSAHTAALGGSTGDRVNWTGGASDMTAVLNLGTGSLAFTNPTAVITTTHTINGAEYLDLSGLSYASATITGNGTADTIVGGKGVDTITGNGGNDTFVFAANASNAAPSGTVFETIADFSTNSDIIDYSADVTVGASATGAVAGTAQIAVGGLATFNGADTTLAQRIVATEAGINLGGTATAGQAALFQVGADGYIFISDGVDGVGANDVLIKLTGVDVTTGAFDTITLTAGNFVLA